MSCPRRRVLAAAFLVAALLALLGALPAAAHARLLSSTPADGSTVRTLPENVELVFSENIDARLAQVVIEDSAGAVVGRDVQVRGPAVEIPSPKTLPAGPVTVRYRVVSADGHPIAGQIAFTYQGAQRSPSVPGSTTAAATATLTQTPQSQATPAQESSRTSNPMIWVLTAVAVLLIVGLASWFVLVNRRHGR